MDKIPYVQNFTDELDAMPILARGSNAAVFHTIGLLLPYRANGASVRDIAKYTGLSEKTIGTTLTNLQHSGLIEETSGGNYTTAKYIEYKKERKFLSSNDSIYLSQSKSNQSIKSQSLESSTEEDFKKSFQALAAVLLLAGGIRSDEAAAFQLLWDEHPDAELHARALMIMRKKADRPNYRYYERVVRSGAIDYDAAKRSDVVEVNL